MSTTTNSKAGFSAARVIAWVMFFFAFIVPIIWLGWTMISPSDSTTAGNYGIFSVIKYVPVMIITAIIGFAALGVSSAAKIGASKPRNLTSIVSSIIIVGIILLLCIYFLPPFLSTFGLFYGHPFGL